MFPFIKCRIIKNAVTLEILVKHKGKLFIVLRESLNQASICVTVE